MNSIKDVEIFATGNHNRDHFSEADLDAMVDAYHALDFVPAIKVGHVKDRPGDPAYGYVAKLRRVGNKLVADFTHMHESVVDAIRDGRYGRVSAEIYFNLRRAGRIFPRALKAVALLGSEIPAVAGLVPLHSMKFANTDEGCDWVANATEQLIAIAGSSAGEALDEAVKRAMAGNGATYSQALTAVLKARPDLARAYSESFDYSVSATSEAADEERRRNAMGDPDAQDRGGAGVEIARLMAREIAKNPTLSQMVALNIVLTKRPDLKKAYEGTTSVDAIMGARSMP